MSETPSRCPSRGGPLTPAPLPERGALYRTVQLGRRRPVALPLPPTPEGRAPRCDAVLGTPKGQQPSATRSALQEGQTRGQLHPHDRRGFEDVGRLKSLRYLDLSGNHASGEGRDNLSKALPGCTVN
jgi:hypothetical protein